MTNDPAFAILWEGASGRVNRWVEEDLEEDTGPATDTLHGVLRAVERLYERGAMKITIRFGEKAKESDMVHIQETGIAGHVPTAEDTEELKRLRGLVEGRWIAQGEDGPRGG